MSQVRRIYVEKKEAFAGKARGLHSEIKNYLGINEVTGVRVLIRYDVENISDEYAVKNIQNVAFGVRNSTKNDIALSAFEYSIILKNNADFNLTFFP